MKTEYQIVRTAQHSLGALVCLTTRPKFCLDAKHITRVGCIIFKRRRSVALQMVWLQVDDLIIAEVYQLVL